MNSLTDQQLLCDYTECRSETAFAELVRRHIDFVYSAALRMVRDEHLAEDVTQNVFVALAQNARQLTSRPVLSGWLHRTAQNIAAKIVRTEVRRRAREQEAAAMNELLAREPDAVWENIAPHLDDALGELSEPDRDALLLRYFERKSAREMAQTLGVSEEAAQKRVNRAVERLRELFSKRNVTIGASGLVVLISTNAVQAAPVGLIALISSAVTLTTITIATHTTMHWLNVKSIAAILTAAITAGTVTHLAQQAGVKRLRNENQNLIAQQKQLSDERDTAVALALQNTDELARLQKNQNELLRLRGEASLLRKQSSDLAILKEENRRLRAASSILQDNQPTQAAQTNFPKESWAFAGYASPEAAMHTWIWAMDKGDKKAMLDSLVPDEQSRFKKIPENEPVTKSPFVAYNFVTKEIISDDEATLTLIADFPDGKKTGEMKMSLRKIGNDWKVAGQAKE